MVTKKQKNIDGKIETKILKLSDIKDNPKNPKKHDADFLIRASKKWDT